MSSSSCSVRPPASSKVVVLLFIMTVGRRRAVMGIGIHPAAMPGQRRLVYLCAVLVGAETGLGDQAGRHRRPAPPPGRHVSLCERGRASAMMLTVMQFTLRTAPGGPGGRTVAPTVPSASSRVTIGRHAMCRSMGTLAPGRRSISRSTSCAGAFGSPSATFLPPGAPGGLMKPQVQAAPAFAEGRQRVSFDRVVIVDGAEAAECRFRDVAAHLRACGPCGEDFDGLLAAAAGAAS